VDDLKLIDLDTGNIMEYGICGYKSPKRPGFPEKVEWCEKYSKQGLRIKALVSDKTGNQGIIEYIPGEYAWRPVDAKGYMFIHCLFVGFKREYKGKGYATLLIDVCIQDAKKKGMSGVAVVTRKGAFMVGTEPFLKNGFQKVDKAPPDFEMLVKKFDPRAPDPKFRKDRQERLKPYEKGLHIIRAYQCPYTVKNVNEISEIAEKEFGINPSIITLKTHMDAQNSPCAFGIFCIVYNGEVVADHPISSRRFMNIMKKIHGY
jgi:hypothetical protein